MNEKPNPVSASSSTGSSTGSTSTSSGATGNDAPLKSTAIETGRDLARDAKHLAGDVVDQAKHSVDSRLSTSKDRAAGTLGTVAEALRHTGGHLKLEKATEGLSGYVGQAADQVERASKYLQTRTMGELVGDVEQFARREPALFLGGAFVAGLVGGRFLKSSTPQRTAGPSYGQASGSVARSHIEFAPRAPSDRSQNRSLESGRPATSGGSGTPPPFRRPETTGQATTTHRSEPRRDASSDRPTTSSSERAPTIPNGSTTVPNGSQQGNKPGGPTKSAGSV